MSVIKVTSHSGEVNEAFFRGMATRMDVSFHKYGRFRKNYEGQYSRAFIADFKKTVGEFLDRWEKRHSESTTAGGNAVLFLLRRLYTYVVGGPTKGGIVPAGNTEYLMDAANGCMIEFECPQVPKAEFKETDTEGSTGFSGLSEVELKEIRERDDE